MSWDGRYCGEDPKTLAEEIGRALAQCARGNDRRMMPEGAITFFEGELRLIQTSLRNQAKSKL